MQNIGILIIDDDLSIFSVLELMLKPEGFNIFKATTKQELFCFSIEKVSIDLILLDTKISSISEVTNQLNLNNSNIPIILMSGTDIASLFDQGFSDGAYCILYKPLNMEEIFLLIKKIYNRS